MKCQIPVSQANMVTSQPCIFESDHDGPCDNPGVPAAHRKRQRWEGSQEDPEIQEARRVLGTFQQVTTAENWSASGNLLPHPQQVAEGQRVQAQREEERREEQDTLREIVKNGIPEHVQDLVTSDEIARRVEEILAPIREALLNYVMDQFYPLKSVPQAGDNSLKLAIKDYAANKISFTELLKMVD